jgi:hypothetical protein
MLRAGHAPVACRVPNMGGSSAECNGVNASCAAPVLVGSLLLGCNALQRRSLSAPAPPPALRARRGALVDVSFRVRYRGERAAEVRTVLCFSCLRACLTGPSWLCALDAMATVLRSALLVPATPSRWCSRCLRRRHGAARPSLRHAVRRCTGLWCHHAPLLGARCACAAPRGRLLRCRTPPPSSTPPPRSAQR